ncbi:MAG TPA: NAD(P)-binding protein [Methanocellales archaeon]|nr:NAD(P)-binding protein [Methanocellales archaeon]
MDRNVLILGAGPAGLSAASKLLSNRINFSLIERESVIGGLAKTIKYGPCSLDIGPHILCTKPYIYDYNEKMYLFIRELLGNRLLHYEVVNRKYLETVRIGMAEFDYPIQIKNALQNVGFVHTMHVVHDYLDAKLLSSDNFNGNLSFEQKLISQLGRSLADLFILKYSEKIWGNTCSELSADLAKRVGEFSIWDVLKEQISNFLMNLSSHSGHPVCYPEQGIGLICEQIKANIEKANIGEIKTNSFPICILHDNKRIQEVMVCEQGTTTSYQPSYLLSSIPIGQFVQLLNPKPPNEVIESALSLKYRSHLCLYILVNKSRVLREHCIYYPDPKIPFARIMEQKNYSQKCCPDDITALTIEFFCWYKDDLWNKDASGLLKIAIPKLGDLGIIKEDEIIDYFVHREKNAYPVYDLGYGDRLKTVMAYLGCLRNLKLIGRTGTFTYGSMGGQYRSMESGSNAAQNIISDFLKESSGDLS